MTSLWRNSWFFWLYCKGREFCGKGKSNYYCFIPLLTWLVGCRFDSKVILSFSAIIMFCRNCVCCQRLQLLRGTFVIIILNCHFSRQWISSIVRETTEHQIPWTSQSLDNYSVTVFSPPLSLNLLWRFPGRRLRLKGITVNICERVTSS